jgi:hypothetical protein
MGAPNSATSNVTPQFKKTALNWGRFTLTPFIGCCEPDCCRIYGAGKYVLLFLRPLALTVHGEYGRIMSIPGQESPQGS